MKTYYYFNPAVDEKPVPVKIIQEIKRKDSHEVEINRDFQGRAGFFVPFKCLRETDEMTNQDIINKTRYVKNKSKHSNTHKTVSRS